MAVGLDGLVQDGGGFGGPLGFAGPVDRGGLELGLELGGAGADGLEVGGAGADGLEVGGAGADGLEVGGAGADGLELGGTGTDGFEMVGTGTETVGREGFEVAGAEAVMLGFGLSSSGRGLAATML